jgi:hypothetical protein
VPAVWGFEKRQGGWSHPVVRGAVVHKRDFAAILKKCVEMKQKADLKKEEKDKAQAKKAWRQLIRSILVRRFVSNKYE